VALIFAVRMGATTAATMSPVGSLSQGAAVAAVGEGAAVVRAAGLWEVQVQETGVDLDALVAARMRPGYALLALFGRE